MPLIQRLKRSWQYEDEVVRGLSYPSMRIFWASELGMIQRKRALFSRRWKIRLS